MAPPQGQPVGLLPIPIVDPVRAFLPRRYWNRAKDYFVYSVEYNTLAASAAAAEQTFTVQADSDFLVTALSAVGATATAGTTELTFFTATCNIIDSGSGQNWFSAFQHLHNVFGRPSFDGSGARKEEVPRLVPAASTVTVQLTNLEATARRYWLSFHGVKIYRNKALEDR